MKKKLINILKYNKRIYTVYFYVFSFVMNLLKFFVKPDDKLILFNSYAGRKYDDSPKVIFEHMLSDERFKDYHFIWAFHEPERYVVNGAEKIKTDTLKYFITALKARAWITNSSVDRGLDFKGKHTLYFNTWHGTPMKKMGTDIDKGNKAFGSKAKNHFDVMMSQGRYETEIFSRSFDIPKENFLECGLPRNDIYVNYTEEYRSYIKEKIGIEGDKKIILYCPTFREYEKDENQGCVLIPPMDLRKWQNILESNYVLLFRAHYEVAKVMEIQENDFVRNMTAYPDLSELMIVSDILISDYSSVFFDYSIMDKVMLHFSYDYEKYIVERGMYFDIREYISGGKNEDDILLLLQNLVEDVQTDKNDILKVKENLKITWESEIEKTREFRSNFVNFYGNAGKIAVNEIYQRIK